MTEDKTDGYFVFDGYKIKRCCEYLERMIDNADAAWVSDDGELCIEYDIYEDGECVSEEWGGIEKCPSCGTDVSLEKMGGY